MFDKDSFLRLLYTILISILITLLVLATFSDYKEACFIVLKGIFAGFIIWLLGELLFPMCEKLYPRSILPSYLVLALLIATGTAGFAYIFGMRALSVLVKICLVAEICGIGITILYRRHYTKTLNANLEKNKTKMD